MSKKKTHIVLWILIILVSVLDAGSQVISNFFPVIGQVIDSISNGVFELIQLGLIYGLWRTAK